MGSLRDVSALVRIPLTRVRAKDLIFTRRHSLYITKARVTYGRSPESCTLGPSKEIERRSSEFKGNSGSGAINRSQNLTSSEGLKTRGVKGGGGRIGFENGK